jgi:hypothetical protein
VEAVALGLVTCALWALLVWTSRHAWRRLNVNGHPQSLVPAEPGNARALAHGVYSPRALSPRVAEIAADLSGTTATRPTWCARPSISWRGRRRRASHGCAGTLGGFARIIQGTEELTHGLDLTP